MTVPSCIAAVETLLTSNIAGLVTVSDIETAEPVLTPEDCPGVIIQDRNYVEKALSGEVYAINQCDFDLDLHLWMYFDEADIPEGGTAFRTTVEAIKALFRAEPYLGGLANTTTSQVLIAGRRMESTIDPWMHSTSGQMLCHGMIRVHVMEIAFIAG